MSRPMTVSDSIIVPATPEKIYAQVSDPTVMGRWSPENKGAVVHEPRDAAYVGMVFDGHNKRGPSRWTTRCTVTAADPGKHFEFRVGAIGVKKPHLHAHIATWEYRFDAVDGGTKVTETWTDGRSSWPDAAAFVFDKIVTSGHTFAEFQAKNINKTLRNLARAFATQD